MAAVLGVKGFAACGGASRNGKKGAWVPHQRMLAADENKGHPCTYVLSSTMSIHSRVLFSKKTDGIGIWTALN